MFMGGLMRHFLIAAVLAGSSFPSLAADMLGSTLTFLRAYPTSTTPFWSNSTKVTTVAAGPGDLIDWYQAPGDSGFHLTVNPEATTITFQLLSASSWIDGGGTFDGIVITGFGAALSAAAVATNSTGLTVVPTIAAPGELRVGLHGSHGVSGFTLNVSLVPEPSPSLLLAAGLLAVGWMRLTARRKARRTAASPV